MTCDNRFSPTKSEARKPVLLFVVNEAFFFLSHRYRLATLARERGFDVHVAAPVHHTWAPEGFDALELEGKLGVTVHRIPLSRRGQNPLVEISTFLSIARLILRVKPEVIHLITMKPILYGGIAARLLRTKAVTISITGFGHVFSSRGLLAHARRFLVSFLLRLVMRHRNCAVIVQSDGDQAFLSETRMLSHPAQVKVIRGSGVDLGTFSASPETEDGPLIVLFAARLLWDKGVEEFVEAARCLRAQNEHVRFVIAGDTRPDNPRSVPKSTLEAWNAEGVVSWIGRREDMPELLTSCAIACLPTKYGEGVPRFLIEAAASERPIVATDIAGIREVVEHRGNGLLVPEGDVPALVHALSDLIQSRGMRKEMGRRGAMIAAKRFDVEAVAQETISVYQSLVSPSSSATGSLTK